MFAKHIVSCETAKRADCSLSFVGKNEVAFYPHIAGRQGSS